MNKGGALAAFVHGGVGMASVSGSSQRGRKKRRRRKNLGFFRKLLTLFIIAVAIVFGMTIFFKVSETHVEGNLRYSEEEVANASGILVGDNLIMTNKSAAANLILEKLPYVQEVRISRSLPGTITISVKESVAVGVMVSDHSDYWLIDISGKLLERIPESEAENYMQITGVSILSPSAGGIFALSASEKEKENQLKTLLGLLNEYDILQYVREIDMAKSYDIHLSYDDRFEVWLGDYSDMDYKVKYLITVIGQLSENQKGVIDLTFVEDKVARFRPT